LLAVYSPSKGAIQTTPGYYGAWRGLLLPLAKAQVKSRRQKKGDYHAELEGRETAPQKQKGRGRGLTPPPSHQACFCSIHRVHANLRFALLLVQTPSLV
jgi:hypothetical protein